MCSLTNLTSEQCALLVDVVESEQRRLQSHSGKTHSENSPRDGRPTRLETVSQLLRKLKWATSTPAPDDWELRQMASYY
jgi:hypothetical protein